jgi:TonB family protein
MSWTHYILQVNIYLVIFYGFYKLLLDKETYFTLNRVYLVSAGLLSLAIPFLRFEWFTKQPVAQPVYIGVDQINQIIQTTVISSPAAQESNFSILNFIAFLYVAGVLFFLVRFIVQLFSVRKMLKQTRSGAAFSFFSKKVVDKELPQSPTIHKHEDIHMRQLHTLDVLFFEIVGAITWFNPIIYFYKNTVKNIHEYLADEEAARFQGDKEEYSLLLLSSAFGVAPSSLTNNFFSKSLIKKRIFMLHKQRSRKTAILKYGLFVPLFAITLIMSSATIRNNEKIQAVADQLPISEPLNIVKDVVQGSIVNPVQIAISAQTTNTATEKPTKTAASVKDINVTLMPVTADWKDFYDYLKKNIKYPSAAHDANVQGNVQIKMRIANGRSIVLGTDMKPLGYGCEEEIMNNILAYKNFENVPNGYYAVNVVFALSGNPITPEPFPEITGYQTLSTLYIQAYSEPIVKNQAGRQLDIQVTRQVEQDTKVYEFMSLERQPNFPGGFEKFYAYLKQQVKYPAEALENKIQGKVYLSFVVEKDGELTDIKVNRKLGYGTDEEAVRILKASPKWYPGIFNGKPVRVKYNFPISFSLSGTSVGSLTPYKRKSLQDIIMIRGVNGNNTTIDVNGKSSPLFVVDGVKYEEFTKISSLNTEDLASISILRGEDAMERYGDQAKNGAVIIKTRANDIKVTERVRVVEDTKVYSPESKKAN